MAVKIPILTFGHPLGDILLNAVKEKSTRRACVEREGFRKASQGLGLEESWRGAAENHSGAAGAKAKMPSLIKTDDGRLKGFPAARVF